MSERDMEHMMMMMLHNAVTQVEMEEGSATTVSQNFKLWDLSLGLVLTFLNSDSNHYFSALIYESAFVVKKSKKHIDLGLCLNCMSMMLVLIFFISLF